MELLVFTGVLVLVVLFIGLLLDLLAHISRYRGYLRSYPATKQIRGKIWKATK